MYLGKAIRLGRLFNGESGRLLAITLQKGIAARVFSPAYATAGISLIVKATSYSPFHPTLDTPTATVEEAVRLGAGAISVGMLVGGADRVQQLTHLSSEAREAEALGLPLATGFSANSGMGRRIERRTPMTGKTALRHRPARPGTRP